MFQIKKKGSDMLHHPPPPTQQEDKRKEHLSPPVYLSGEGKGGNSIPPSGPGGPPLGNPPGGPVSEPKCRGRQLGPRCSFGDLARGRGGPWGLSSPPGSWDPRAPGGVPFLAILPGSGSLVVSTIPPLGGNPLKRGPPLVPGGPPGASSSVASRKRGGSAKSSPGRW